jgi:hypothetical protein
MTALQSIIKEAKSLRAKYPKRFTKWTDYVKQASAIYAAKHKGKSPVGKKKVAKKKVGAAKPVSKHKDTKSHNVNIRVVSGIGALPVGFKGNVLGVKFKVINQFDIYNNVSCIIENETNGDKITVVDGSNLKNNEIQFLNYIKYFTKDKSEINNQIKIRLNKFLSELNKEVKQYNSGKKTTTKKKPLVIKKVVSKPVVHKNTITRVKEVLKSDHKRLKGGYTMTKGNVRMGAINLMAIEDYKKSCELLNKLQNVLNSYQHFYKNSNLTILAKKQGKIDINKLKIKIKELKIHIREQKKLL